MACTKSPSPTPEECKGSSRPMNISDIYGGNEEQIKYMPEQYDILLQIM